MDKKLGTELVSKNALSLINDNECTFRWSPLGGGFNRTGIGCMLTGPSLSTMNPEKSRSRQTTIQMTTAVEAKKRSSSRMILSTSGVWTRRYADDL